MSRPPDFDELVGGDILPAERERLRRAHDLILRAGPPPELEPGMESVPWPREAEERRPAGPRRRSPLMVAAVLATVAAAGFLLGQVRSAKPDAFTARFVRTMHGTRLAPGATASLEVGAADRDGNWPMRFAVSGLASLPAGGYYELYLSRGGRPVAPCGSFTVQGRTASIRLSEAYLLKRFDGWIVTRRLPGERESGAVFLTT